ncbi:hypothetical protein GGI12_003477, partial [Dipsacomyces acuminosporus]
MVGFIPSYSPSQPSGARLVSGENSGSLATEAADDEQKENGLTRISTTSLRDVMRNLENVSQLNREDEDKEDEDDGGEEGEEGEEGDEGEEGEDGDDGDLEATKNTNEKPADKITGIKGLENG